MTLSQARKIANTIKDDPQWSRDYLSTDDTASAFSKLDYNANRNQHDGDKALARAIWDFHGN